MTIVVWILGALLVVSVSGNVFQFMYGFKIEQTQQTEVKTIIVNLNQNINANENINMVNNEIRGGLIQSNGTNSVVLAIPDNFGHYIDIKSRLLAVTNIISNFLTNFESAGFKKKE